MIDTKKNEEIRAARNLLTVAVFDQLVNECLGKVPVLCVIGRCRSGKTWAAQDWIAGRTDDKEHVAHVDCGGFCYGDEGKVQFAGGEQALRKAHYPKFALDGIDIVVVDDGSRNPRLVQKLIDLTAADAGTAAHRLIVLLLQDVREVEQFEFGEQLFMTYSTAGLPI